MVSATEYEAMTLIKQEWLKTELQKGLDDIQAGRVTDGTDVLERLRQRAVNAAL